MPLLQSHETSTPEQKEEVGAGPTESFVGATAAVALSEVSGEPSAAPLSLGELTTGNDSPLARQSLGTAIATKSVAAAVAVVTMPPAASPAWSPLQEDEDVHKTSPVGAGVAAGLTSLVSEKRCRRGHSRAFKLPQPEPQSEPKLPTLSAPSPQAAKFRTANEVRPLRFRPRVDDGTEGKEQDRKSITNPTSTLVREATVERTERQPAAVAATASEEPKAEAVYRGRTASSEATTTSSKNHIVDRMAAGVATAPEKPRIRKRGEFTIPGVAAGSAVGPLFPRAASTGMRLWPRLAVVPPTSPPANAKDGPMDGDGSFRASFKERRVVSESCLPRGETDIKTNVRMDTEATNEARERMMQDGARLTFDAEDVATGTAMLSKGRSLSRAERRDRWI